jgi:hypothetical protein
MCISIFLLPFIVCDLYYAYNNNSCTHISIKNYNIGINLATWLKVDGYINLSISGVLLFVGFVTCCFPVIGLALGIFYLFFMGIVSLFNTAWIIVGAVMFWGDLDKGSSCDNGLKSYMYARLIIGIVSGVCSLFSHRKVTNQGNE